VREVRFHRDLYVGECVDEAMKVYSPYAEITPIEGESHWIVQIEASSPARERRIGDEMANYALGLTVRTRVA